MIALARRIADSRAFQNCILVVILLTAGVIGLETSPAMAARFGSLFAGIDVVVQAIFVIEIAIRVLAYWPRPLRFFADGWNVFDLSVVAASLLPQAGAFAMVARLARLMRVARLVSVFPELRLIVSTMLRSIPSMGHVIVMLGLLVYMYAVVGLYMFRDVSPQHWGTLGRACLTLFQMLTLEGWVEVQGAVLDTYSWAWVYFGSYILVAVFVVVNLFIAVVINNLETAKVELQAAADRESPHTSVLIAIEDLRSRLADLERLLRELPPATKAPSPADAT